MTIELLAVVAVVLWGALGVVTQIQIKQLRKRIETLDLHVVYLFKHQHDGRFELRRNTK